MIYHIVKRMVAKVKRSVELVAAKTRVRMASKYVSGPRKIILKEDEVVLVCMLKNGSFYLSTFLEHHRSIGIRHFLFIDNGSEDGTLGFLSAQEGVTVISNHLPVKTYESRLRSDIARWVTKGGWFLFSDIDELIEMLNGEGREIREYAAYCNENGYDAVVSQSLDLFAATPLSETENWSFERSVAEFDQFSLHYIDEFSYHDKAIGFSWFLQSNTISNPSIRLKFGGIRKELFGENCALTKHSMVKNAAHIWIYSHPHCSSNVHCADFNLLVRHYKFAGAYLQRERKQMRDKVWDHGEDQSRLAAIIDPNFTFSSKEAQRFSGTAQLLDQGFLTGSVEFLARFPSSGSAVPRDLA